MGMDWEPSQAPDRGYDEAEVPYQPRHAARPRFLRGLHPARHRARHEPGAEEKGLGQEDRSDRPERRGPVSGPGSPAISGRP
jgi:hypothetical protein